MLVNLAHTVHRNWISSSSVGPARCSPHNRINRWNKRVDYRYIFVRAKRTFILIDERRKFAKFNFTAHQKLFDVFKRGFRSPVFFIILNMYHKAVNNRWQKSINFQYTVRWRLRIRIRMRLRMYSISKRLRIFHTKMFLTCTGLCTWTCGSSGWSSLERSLVKNSSTCCRIPGGVWNQQGLNWIRFITKKQNKLLYDMVEKLRNILHVCWFPHWLFRFSISSKKY